MPYIIKMSSNQEYWAKKQRDKFKRIKSLLEEVMFEINVMESKENSTEEAKILSQLLNLSVWPKALSEKQIARNEDDKNSRAKFAIDTILPPLKGKRFLDFGCGEGHMAKYAAKFSSFSMGYDIQKNWNEESMGEVLLTTNILEIKEKYDVILIHDVLDHCGDPASVLSTAKDFLKRNGRIYLRCHPWCSRHGHHAHEKINKAFIHLVFDEKELLALGVNIGSGPKNMFPLSYYEQAIEKSGLHIEQGPEITRSEIEPFFWENYTVKRRILNAFNMNEWTSAGPEFQMSMSFVDYVLVDQIHT